MAVMNNTHKTTKIYLYTRYERFWHWFQGAIITILLITGLEVHGSFTLLGFRRAVQWHNFLGITWLITFAFFVFWVFTTGEWKQYIPTTKKVFQVIQYYTFGIFAGLPHPVPKRKEAKHNPLQRLTYLSIAMFLLPFQMITGFLYWGYNSWAEWGITDLTLRVIALLHMAGAFGILVFVVIHIYMTTTGHSLFAHIKGMITGWEEVEKEEPVEEWERRHE